VDVVAPIFDGWKTVPNVPGAGGPGFKLGPKSPFWVNVLAIQARQKATFGRQHPPPLFFETTAHRFSPPITVVSASLVQALPAKKDGTMRLVFVGSPAAIVKLSLNSK